ncbi:hypothetical protein D9756_004614 [Leucocoprinus leucothites]|uniref:UBA domain-containing protein n=1 Tax=Leucocoprinus leucothites TaxID=201217 RepID=A0A8H5LKM3_9AGAR|nr:hypothetical protein D9756_004614 [Leucoagaricus leucothites]
MVNPQGILNGAHDLIIDHCNLVDNSIVINETVGLGPGSGIHRLLRQSMPDAFHDSSARYPPPACHYGTRQEYIAMIRDWGLGAPGSHQEQIFWMDGPAGVGKSAVAQSCAELFAEQGRLAASIFFSRPNRRQDHNRLFTSISYQVATKWKPFAEVVDLRIREDPTLVTKAIREQFRELLVRPMQQLRSEWGGSVQGRVIIVDGLDECDTIEAQIDILEIIATSVREQTTPFRWMLTSRPERHIISMFVSNELQPLALRVNLPVSRKADHDILLYITDEMAKIRQRFGLPQSWPSEVEFAGLVDLSGGLFIYSNTAIRFIGDLNSLAGPEKRLHMVLALMSEGSNGPERPLAVLDAFYTLIMQNVPSDILPTLQKILLLHEMMRRADYNKRRIREEDMKVIYISNMLQLSEAQLRNALAPLYAALEINPVSWRLNLNFYHASFMEFLVDPIRSHQYSIIGVMEDVRMQLLGYLNAFHASKKVTCAELPWSFPPASSWLSGTTTLEQYGKHLYHTTMETLLLLCHHDPALKPKTAESLMDFDFRQVLFYLGTRGPPGISSNLMGVKQRVPAKYTKKIVREPSNIYERFLLRKEKKGSLGTKWAGTRVTSGSSTRILHFLDRLSRDIIIRLDGILLTEPLTVIMSCVPTWSISTVTSDHYRSSDFPQGLRLEAMSDSFADLWNTTTSQKKPQTLSSLTQQQPSTQQGQRRPQGGQDIFALLSSTSSSSTPTSTANVARSSPSLRSSTPSSTFTSTPPPSRPQQQQQQQRPSADAFSDLFSSSASSSRQNLTIAQKAALADKERKEAILAHQRQQEKEKTAWAGLDSLGLGGNVELTPKTTNGSKSIPASASKGSVDEEDDWGLGDFGKPSATTSSQDKTNTQSAAPENNTDDWNFDSFSASQTQPVKSTTNSNNKTTKTSSGGGLWDLDEFTSPSASTPAIQPQTQRARADSPSDDFNFGDREDGLLNDDNGDEFDGGGQRADDDFMSVFDKPPEPRSTSRQQTTTSSPPGSSSSPAPPQTRNQGRTASPPPHILGQIVEMGFSVPKAKAALAVNNNDVQAALDQLLVSEGGYAGGSGVGGRGTPTRSADSPAPAQAPHPRRRDREREVPQQPSRRGDTSSPSLSATASTGDIQAQAEQILAQASEIGRGVFTKASLFWKEKKEQVQKVVEEHRTSSAASGGSNSGRGGKPKWMQQAGEGDDDVVVSPKSAFRDDDGASGGFRDDIGAGPSRRKEGEREREPEVWIPKRPDRQRERERQRVREREAAAAVPVPTQPPVEEPEIDLFAPAPVPAPTQPTIFQASSSSAPRRPQPSSTPRSRQQPSQPVKPRYQRNTSAISSSIAALKSEANATFKLGQFGNAETLYTRAIDSLRSSSSGSDNLYFVLLLNNRANARMKTGDVGGAVRDCEGVIGLITTNHWSSSDADFDALGAGSSSSQDKVDWDPSYDANATKHTITISGAHDVQEETVDLVDGLTKAIKRRAEAYEGLEKWNKAKNDWELLRSSAWVRNEGIRGEAGRGVGRCVRMTGGGGGSSSNGGMNGSSSSARPPAPKPKPRPRPAAPTTTTNADKPSSALNALRTTTAAAEAEDQAKHELKDTVDARLSNWKNGKENNIRALLASLDTVLWDELVNSGGGVKVGMHELVTPGQVKVKYMKAVAKVHPDKLNASNSTLEQRMIAQGVFGALNEAWNAFK